MAPKRDDTLMVGTQVLPPSTSPNKLSVVEGRACQLSSIFPLLKRHNRLSSIDCIVPIYRKTWLVFLPVFVAQTENMLLASCCPETQVEK